uniref:Integrase n=1 Tax=Ditylenchus dipsaci TaxID=166011 RepID=A0A915DN01_9BILA
MENLLKKIYFDVNSPACYSSVQNVLEEAKKKNPKVTINDVKRFLEKQSTYTRFRNSVKKFPRLKTIPNGLNTHWQADLAVFSSIAKENKNYNYLLVCVDVLSRKLYVDPVEKKTGKYMIPAFENIFKRAKAIPWKIFTDAGLEFCSKEMMAFYDKHAIIKHNAQTHPILHATIVERANRTIKDRLYKYFNEKDTTVWVDVIQKIVNSINNTVNSTTGVKPNSVTYKNANSLFDRMYDLKEEFKTIKNKICKFKVGDTVRFDRYKQLFTKGLAKFSDEIFIITEVLTHHDPTVYRIKDLSNEPIKGYFYEKELIRTALESNYQVEKVLKTRKVRGKIEYFVKWKGFRSSFNSWTTEDNLV